jgi:hypothetical protein
MLLRLVNGQEDAAPTARMKTLRFGRKEFS